MADMCQRRFHYDLAFEGYLRQRAIPYVAVDEAKRALHRPMGVGGGAAATQTGAGVQAGAGAGAEVGVETPAALKSFDFVVYSETGRNLLVDVKGRKHAGGSGGGRGGGGRAMQNWVTRDDITSLRRWRALFGEGFQAVFAFLYWCEATPEGALFQDVFEAGDRWYCLLGVELEAYAAHMKPRSARWDTVSLPAAAFRELAKPFHDLV